jgi:hypothetical protein
MHSIEQMTKTNPQPPAFEVDQLTRCIEACFDCAQSCTACADACLGESDPRMLARCIRLNLDCADVCTTTGKMLSRQQHPDLELLRQQLAICALACRVCAEECERHASAHEHCRVCMESCRRCEAACMQLGGGLDGSRKAGRA